MNNNILFLIQLLCGFLSSVLILFISLKFSKAQRDKYSILKIVDGRRIIFVVIIIILLAVACICQYLKGVNIVYPEPKIAYSIVPMPSDYVTGINVDGLTWQKNYQEYILRIENESKRSEIVDLYANIDLIGGLVKQEIIFVKGAENVSSSAHGFDSVSKVSKDGRVPLNYYDNNFAISIGKLFPEGSVKIKLVVVKSDSDNKGYLEINYRYNKTKQEPIKVRRVYPVYKKGEQDILYIDYDNPVPKGTVYYQSIGVMFAPPKKN